MSIAACCRLFPSPISITPYCRIAAHFITLELPYYRPYYHARIAILLPISSRRDCRIAANFNHTWIAVLPLTSITPELPYCRQLQSHRNCHIAANFNLAWIAVLPPTSITPELPL